MTSGAVSLWRIYPPAGRWRINVEALGMEKTHLGEIAVDPERESVVTVVFTPNE